MCARRAPGGGTARDRAPGRAAGDYPAATTPRVIASRPWSPACRVTLVPPQVTRVPDAMVFRQVTRVLRMVQLVDAMVQLVERVAPQVTRVPWRCLVQLVDAIVQLVDRGAPAVTLVPDAVPVWQVTRVPSMVQLVERVTRVPDDTASVYHCLCTNSPVMLMCYPLFARCYRSHVL
ncbi:hypothetical protein [Spongiactinospora gelatinilytica]|uniref:hypothetical protein n=1 Tax=Spongiactinospora gelatinilytica TaxID=2666298 RepID=UPI00131436F4|nr:hypothetical protein [Spongiactinospora gelatinilytica]